MQGCKRMVRNLMQRQLSASQAEEMSLDLRSRTWLREFILSVHFKLLSPRKLLNRAPMGRAWALKEHFSSKKLKTENILARWPSKEKFKQLPQSLP